MVPLSWTLVGSFLLLFAHEIASLERKCSYFLTESAGGSGLGVFLNHDVEPFDILEKSLGIPIPFHCVLWNPLIFYVEGLNGSHALLALGAGMLLNHAPGHLANVRKVMLYEDGAWAFREPFQRSIDFLHEYTAFAKSGEELLVDYGEGWFEERGLPVTDLFSGNNLDLKGEGTSNTFDDYTQNITASCSDYWMSLRPERKEVVAVRAISRGTVIEQSRALLIPVTDYLITSGPLEEILWWFNEEPRLLQSQTEYLPTPYTIPDHGSIYGEYAILLSGKSALLSPSSANCENVSSILANVELRYVLKETSQQCDNIMVVETVAMRDIAPGEILYMDSCLRLPNQRKVLQGASRKLLKQCMSVEIAQASQVDL